MSERKVLNKYYSPDFDPSKIPRVKKKNKQNDVRIMAPFNLKCNTCGNYIASATKFNAKKETVEDEKYKSVEIYRFYIKCPRCMATIIWRTDPKQASYVVEHGATENFMALKIAERQAREEAEADEEEEKINPMKHLENRTKASKQQLEATEQIQNLRSIKYRYHTVDLDSVIQSKRQEFSDNQKLGEIASEEDEIRTEARKMLKRKESGCPEPSTSLGIENPSLKRLKSDKKTSSSLSDLKKKLKIVPKSSTRNKGDKDSLTS